MVTTRRSRRSDNNRLALGLALLGVVAGIVVAIGLLMNQAAKARVPLNPNTQCPIDGPRSITAVIIDRTDPVSPITERDIRNRLQELAAEVPKYGALYLFAIDGASDGLGEPLFFRCNPGDASTVNNLTASTRKVERRFQEQFAAPLETVLKDLALTKTAPISPIMEVVQGVAVAAFSGKSATSASPRRLIIVSDFMQNSGRVSFYGHGRGSQLEAPEVLDAPLTGVEVGLLFIQRPDRGGPSIDELKSVWRQYFIESGVAPAQVRPIKLTGANP